METAMDFIIIFFLFLIGAGFHIMAKVTALKLKYIDEAKGKIWTFFFREEWDVFIVMGLILALMMVTLFIIRYNEIKLPQWVESWGMYVGAVVLGYAGQRIIYKYLGTAENVLMKRAELIDKENKTDS